ncbi:hypothetical protein GYMLUDRAFT_43018 [Collybiopsis luxurians FD-317 M1]|uniref:NADH:flavin oxidoreductase/NADH oxidase N-terminal domain-containing protein n=1 Tax=Collybiopsis luxurians FD-317 M1 TaxID=944289 RepID=A0A0D0CFU7_9AGAR|nr:hypothetical protein GYMLUDRAFT_43018 [Collybiopsis luxurians FD-317 M1]
MVTTPTSAQTPSRAALFQPAQVGFMTLKHRVVLAPLTRMRADTEHVPHPIVKEYYSQRASVPGSLLIAEATLISHQAGGYAHVPGIWTNEQISRWKEITQAIHSKGSFVYLQLWALGRTATPQKHILPEIHYRLANTEPNFPFDFVSASDISISPDDPQKPRPLTIDEIKEYPKWYATAAKNAIDHAGFDGVEIHGANGYLIDQFLQDVSNNRTDAYGGSVENRARFGLEVVDAVVQAVGPERTAIRISPWASFQGMRMKDPKPTFRYFVQELQKAHPNLSYLHLVEPRVDGYYIVDELPEGEDNDFIREIWTQEGNSRWLISAGGYNRDTAIQAVELKGGLVAFGRAFLANPDLPLRLESNIPLNKGDRNTYYIPDGSGPEGYTDYPSAPKEKSKIQELNATVVESKYD